MKETRWSKRFGSLGLGLIGFSIILLIMIYTSYFEYNKEIDINVTHVVYTLIVGLILSSVSVSILRQNNKELSLILLINTLVCSLVTSSFVASIIGLLTFLIVAQTDYIIAFAGVALFFSTLLAYFYCGSVEDCIEAEKAKIAKKEAKRIQAEANERANESDK